MENNHVVAISDFDKRVLIEQIRYIEAADTLVCDADAASYDLSVHGDFEHRLWQRTEYLVNQHDLFVLLSRPARLSRYTNIVALLCAALLGVLGIKYAFTDSHTINVYWLLLVLLGFNFISILLWFIGISLNMRGMIAGVLARLTSWLPGFLARKSNSSTQSDRAWLACHYGGGVGKWQFSKITHQLWLAYLFAGLVFLVLLLMVRQYDFVWGTTLLTDSAFVKLTDLLSAPLHALGLAIPSAEQVQDSRMGVTQVLTVEHRTHWAQFLLGALLCFGIAPRLLLWCWSALMRGNARRQFRLDFYLPYYINLRQKLAPLASHGQIVDAETKLPVVSDSSLVMPVSQTLPEKTQWVAVELGDHISWPPPSINPDDNLGRIVDRESLTHILQRVQSMPAPVIAVAVVATRSPDRGVKRTIASLMSNSEQRWLVLLQNQKSEAISNSRLAAWYRLAEACKVPADHVISIVID